MPYRCNLRRFAGILFLGSFVFCLWLGQVPHSHQRGWSAIATAQATDTAQLVQEGVRLYQNHAYKAAIAPWDTALKAYQQRHDRAGTALVLENLARAYEQVGQTDQAIVHWEQLGTLYRQANDLTQAGRVQIEQAQAYSRIGQPRKAIALLCNPDPKKNCTNDSTVQMFQTAHKDTLETAALKAPALEAAALGSLGEAYRLIGEYDRAIATVLEAQRRLATTPHPIAYQLSLLNSLGNAYTSRAQVNYRGAKFDAGGDDDRKALDTFAESRKLADEQGDRTAALRSLIGAIPAYYRTKETKAADDALNAATDLLDALPATEERVYMAIDLAQLWQPREPEPTLLPALARGALNPTQLWQLSAPTATLAKNRCLQAAAPPQVETLLRRSIDTARQLNDNRAASFALGALGHFYECRGDFTHALDWTNQARWAADQALHAKDSLYLWEWQTGRILKAQNETKAAIAAYERSLATLETIRGDILTADRDIQFDFRDGVEPIYRELVALKLGQEQPVSTWSKTKDVSASTDASASKQNSTQNFQSILGTIDALKLAELQDYFGSECIIAAASQVGGGARGNVEPETAVFNTFILEQQTAVMLSLPNGQTKFAWIDIPRSTFLEQINAFREGLQRYGDQQGYDIQPAKKIYDWLIRPFAEAEDLKNIKTLVFVQDGILRSVPMGALHDGKQFLIQQYAIAFTPSLKLTDRTPLNRTALRLLALGLTEGKTVEGETFKPLEYVRQEVDDVTKALPGSKPLLDQEFTRDQLQKELNQTAYPIVHIATHGQFGTDPKDTFIITSGDVKGKGEKLTLTDLEALIRRQSRNQEPLELLTLTACNTAVGDDRSALGLAGAAIQSGAKSALASLWQINDEATATIATDFYTHLRNSTLTKAAALQAAQVALLENPQYAHPAYWSPFVLIGNWQ